MDQQKPTDNIIPEEKAVAPVDFDFADEPAEDTPVTTNFDFADEPAEETPSPDEHVPSEFEKKMNAIPEKKWRLYQALIGAALGIATTATLFLSGSSNNMPFLTCIILAFLGPRYFEKQCPSRSINTFRKYMCIFLGIGLAIGAIYYYTQYGFTLTEPTPAA